MIWTLKIKLAKIQGCSVSGTCDFFFSEHLGFVLVQFGGCPTLCQEKWTRQHKGMTCDAGALGGRTLAAAWLEPMMLAMLIIPEMERATPVACLLLLLVGNRSCWWVSSYKTDVCTPRNQVQVLTRGVLQRQFWLSPACRERGVGRRNRNDILLRPLQLKTQQPLKRLAADFSQLTNALSMLVVRVYDISSVEWFCCYGKSAKKGCISCTAQILWVFNIQFLLRTLRIIPLILNCLNVETYGLVCCSLGNNCLYPGCQIQINSYWRNRESEAAQQNFLEVFLPKGKPDV